MAAFVFSTLGGQPLCIAGVTGPITVFNRTIYVIFQGKLDKPNYLFFIGWVYLWSAMMHWALAIFNGEFSVMTMPNGLLTIYINQPATFCSLSPYFPVTRSGFMFLGCQHYLCLLG